MLERAKCVVRLDARILGRIFGVIGITRHG
jgi:hypothetical protein